MEHLRTRWTALAVALLLILSVAGVAGAAHVVLPGTAAPQAQEQVASDHGDEDADEDTTEDTTTEEEGTEPETEDTTEDTDGAQGEHGALVSAVAQNEACVGGEHNNHGWAVSQVARGLLVPEAETGCPPWDPEAVAPETTDTDTDAAAAPGKSGEHRQDAAGKANKANKKHGRP